MAGVDLPNQFPNSKMAAAVKAGQSRFQSQDTPSNVLTPQIENASIATASTLATLAGGSIPSGTTYAAATAVGGPMYVTYDGSTPSAANYAITVAAGNSLPIQGTQVLAAAKFQGTGISVSFWK